MDALTSLPRSIVPSTLGLRAQIPPGHPTVPFLGVERMGTGAIVSSEGLVLTAGYVLMGAEAVTATFPSGETVEAKPLGVDHDSGLGLLRVDRRGLPALPLAEATEVRPGLPVFTVAAFSPEARRTSGGFVTGVEPFDAPWEYMIDRAILTSVINVGFAGSPLLDMEGRLLGTISLSLGVVGRATLAIPIEYYRLQKDILSEPGHRPSLPQRAWVGIFPQPSQDTLVVAGVVPGGPAEAAGLQPGDVLMAIEGKKVSNRREFYRLLWRRSAGERIGMRVFRSNVVHDVQVVAGDRTRFYA